MRPQLLLYFMMLCSSLNAGTFVKDGKKWQVRLSSSYYNTKMANYKNKSVTYALSGDTIINEKPCIRMYGYDTFHSDDIQYLASLFETDNRVYFIPSGHEDSYLMYDFNMSAGETAKVFLAPEYKKQWTPIEIEVEVTDVEYQDVGGTKRKYLYLSDIDSPEAEDTGISYGCWIEGIGSLSSPVWNAEFIRYDQSSTLECCSEDNNILYKQAEPAYYNMLDANTVWVEEYSESGIMQTDDNPARMYFTKLEQPDTQIDESGINIWRKIYACENGDTANSHVVAAMSEKRVNNGDRQDFEKKVYVRPYEGAETSYLLYDFSAEAGDEMEVAVFNFSDDYSVPHKLETRTCRVERVEDRLVEGHTLKHLYVNVADDSGNYDSGNMVCWIEGVGSVYGLDANAGVGLKDGKYPESLLLDCSWEGESFYRFSGSWSDIVNNISTVNTPTTNNNTLYDLSGRRLTSPPNRGIYIENGRKKVRF